MIIDSPIISGSQLSSGPLNQVGNVQITGSLSVTGAINGSITGSITSASYATNAEFLDRLDSTSFVFTSSFATYSGSVSTRETNLEATASTLTTASASFAVVSSSFATTSGSLSTRVADLEATSSTNTQASASFAVVSASFSSTSGSLSTRVTNLEATSSTISSSFATTSGSIAGRVTIIEGQDATTGSNTFTAPQSITDTSNAISFTSTASLYTDGGLRVKGSSFISGTAYFNDVVVYGTSSIEYITSSQVNIGSNIITVNTDTPAVRFGGLSVFDSGSTQLTGSIFWDSEKNHWIYSNPSGSSYNSGMIMSGPRNSGSLGDEQGTTLNALMKGQGGDHITSSQMFDDGTTVRIPGNLQVTGSFSGSAATFTNSVTAGNGFVTTGYPAASGNGLFIAYNSAGSNTGSLYSYNYSTSTYNPTIIDGSNVYIYNSGVVKMAVVGGNMGVGTASPSDRLNVVVAANGNVARFDGPTSGLILQTNATTTDIISYGGTTPAYRTLNFATSATTALSIATSGAATFASSVTANGDISAVAGVGIVSGGGGYAIGPTSTRGVIAINGSGDQLLTFSSQSYIYNSSSLFRMLSSSDIDFVAGGYQRLLIKAATGALCVGGTDAGEKFNIIQGNIKLYTYQNSPGDYRYIGTEYAQGNGNNKAEVRFGIESDTLTFLSFATAGGGGSITERMRVTSGGNVGIGTTSPSYKLSVAGTIGATDLILQGTTNISYSYTTDSSWTSFQTIIPINAYQVAGAVYLVKVQWGSGGSPYVVYAPFLWMCMGSNGGGADNTITPMVSTHQGGTGTMNFRNLAGTGQVASGIQAQLVGFANTAGTLTVVATRLM